LEILETASWAPSAHNAQPWRFIVVSDIAVKRRLARAMAEAWVKDQTVGGVMVNQGVVDFSVGRFSNAPVFIVACLSLEDMQQYRVDDERWLVERDLLVQSLGAAVQNLLLSACGCGLGACWFSAPMFCKVVVRQVLGVPETVEPQAIILMGYSDEKPVVRQRKPVETFCFRDCWNKPF
jgi:F420 biosynthesis protein FbiB-like protein